MIRNRRQALELAEPRLPAERLSSHWRKTARIFLGALLFVHSWPLC
ncbi:MAG TPA: hypothetical protein PLE61_11545 [Vicinamibacterales bacterium]|nr:hypothetical protein [Vicinamibacterales bacterium]HPW21434.1 hypothetical protein [Vicinamibacterales bacterium]